MSDQLPASAEARLAGIRASGTWGSALTADEFAAIRSVGFEPVGQVLGACVYNIGYTGGYACPGAWGNWGYGQVMPSRTTTQVSSRPGWGSFAPLVQVIGRDARGHVRAHLGQRLRGQLARHPHSRDDLRRLDVGLAGLGPLPAHVLRPRDLRGNLAGGRKPTRMKHCRHALRV